jgi:hypothetical protein
VEWLKQCPPVSASLYTDDVATFYSSQNLVIVKCQLLIGSGKWIFLLHSKDPLCTVRMIVGFLCVPSMVSFNTTALPFAPAVKFLGCLLDSTVSWEDLTWGGYAVKANGHWTFESSVCQYSRSPCCFVETLWLALAVPRSHGGTGGLSSLPTRCSPGHRSWIYVASRCVWLGQAPPLLPPWGNWEWIVGFPGQVGRQRTLDVRKLDVNRWKWNSEEVGID